MSSEAHTACDYLRVFTYQMWVDIGYDLQKQHRVPDSMRPSLYDNHNYEGMLNSDVTRQKFAAELRCLEDSYEELCYKANTNSPTGWQLSSTDAHQRGTVVT